MKMFVASQEILRLKIPVNVLYSAQNLKPVNLSWAKEKFLDCGAIYVFLRKGKFPFTPKEYGNFALEQQFDHIASMDYPCEPSFRGKKSAINLSVKKRIEKTVQNATLLSNFIPAEKLYPVIQGYRLKDYEYCIKLYKKEGIIKNQVAVGSLCIRKKLKRIKAILRTVRRELPHVKIHALGLTLLFLRDKDFWVEHLVDSFDTGAWQTRASHGHFYVFNPLRGCLTEIQPYWKGKPQKLSTRELSTLTLKAYLEYFEFIQQHYEYTLTADFEAPAIRKTLIPYIQSSADKGD